MPWGWDNCGHETFSSDDDFSDDDIVFREDEPLSNEYMSKIASLVTSCLPSSISFTKISPCKLSLIVLNESS